MERTWRYTLDKPIPIQEHLELMLQYIKNGWSQVYEGKLKVSEVGIRACYNTAYETLVAKYGNVEEVKEHDRSGE
jgi:hypothetical protein